MQVNKLVLPDADGFHAIELRLRAESLPRDDANELFGSQEVVEKVDAFCKRTKLPLASVVTAAAGGWRFYWLLDRPIHAWEWRQLQDALAIAAEMAHLPADTPTSATDQNDAPKAMTVIRQSNDTKPSQHSAAQLQDILQQYVSSAVFTRRACANPAA